MSYRILSRCLVRATVAGAMLLAVCLWVAGIAAEAAGGRDHPHHRRHHAPRLAYWGAWIGSQLTGTAPPFDMGAADRFEKVVGKGMSLLEFSSPFERCARSGCFFYPFPTAEMQNIRQHGSIPVFGWSSELVPEIPRPTTAEIQPDYQLSDLIDGRYDAYITQFAEEVRAWHHPFFLRFDWEMNGNWFPWGDAINGNQGSEYVAAWRHVHDIFTAVGATNATWLWCPFADVKHRFRSPRAFYPGDAYVDWTCLDGYNWGTNGVNSQRWRGFNQIFGDSYRELTTRVAPRKPVMLAELASSPNGGHKALWIRNMFKWLPRRYPRIRGLIWFDVFDRGIDWPIETSTSATAAFAAGIRKRAYVGSSFSGLTVSPISPPH